MRGTSFSARFGRSVRAAREARKLTQRELADAADIADKYLSRVELGLASPSVDIGVRLARALGVNLDLLVGTLFEEPPELVEIAMLLRERSTDDRARTLRVVRELLR